MTGPTEEKAKPFALYLTTQQRSAITQAAETTGTTKSAQRWSTETLLKVSTIINEGNTEERTMLIGLLHSAGIKK